MEIPRKNMKYARYSADKKIEPLKGDLELSAVLDYTTKDKLFLGYAYIQAVDTNNKVMASVGLTMVGKSAPAGSTAASPAAVPNFRIKICRSTASWI